MALSTCRTQHKNVALGRTVSHRIFKKPLMPVLPHGELSFPHCMPYAMTVLSFTMVSQGVAHSHPVKVF